MKTDSDLALLCMEAYQVHDSAPRKCEYIVRYEGDSTYIAIRGTEFGDKFAAWSLHDLARNVASFPIYSPVTGVMHGGYYAGARAIYRDLKIIAKISGRLVITGHSMGGAIAAPLAQMMHRLTPVARLVLFGCPRCYLRQPSWGFPVRNYRNGSDLVSYVHPAYKQPAMVIELAVNALPVNIFDHKISEYERTLRAHGL